jgi:hypothetical protein
MKAERCFDRLLFYPELVNALKMYEAELCEQTNLINQRRDTPDGEGTS